MKTKNTKRSAKIVTLYIPADKTAEVAAIVKKLKKEKTARSLSAAFVQFLQQQAASPAP